MANLNTALTPAPVITVVNKDGSTASGYTGNVTMALATNPSNATLGGTATVAATAGVATFSNLTLNRSGKDFTLRATAAAQGGYTPKARISRPFTIATRLVFTVQPTGVNNPDDILPGCEVTVQDAAGNTDTEYNGEITLSLYTGAALGILSGFYIRAAVNGVATFTGLSIDGAGTYSFRATAQVIDRAYNPAPAISNTFPVGPYLVFTVQPSTVAPGGAISPSVVVTATNGDGTTATGFAGSIVMTLGPNIYGSVLSGTTTKSAVAGIATFDDLSVDLAGIAYQLIATATIDVGITSTGRSAEFKVVAPPVFEEVYNNLVTPPPPTGVRNYSYRVTYAYAGLSQTGVYSGTFTSADGSTVTWPSSYPNTVSPTNGNTYDLYGWNTGATIDFANFTEAPESILYGAALLTYPPA